MAKAKVMELLGRGFNKVMRGLPSGGRITSSWPEELDEIAELEVLEELWGD
jgi:hypothetical protein